MSELVLDKKGIKKGIDNPIVWISKKVHLLRKLINLKSKLKSKVLKDGFELHSIQNAEEEDEMYRLRYRVYCEEFKYLNASDFPEKKEKDIYDPYSVHFVIKDTSNSHDKVIGTVRIIRNSEIGLPIEKHFKLDIDKNRIPRENLVEVSRFIVEKKYRIDNFMLDLVRELYHYARRFNVEYVYSVMDERLYLPLIKMGYPFVKIGDTKEYQGTTTPFLLKISKMGENINRTNPLMYSYLIEGLEDRFKPKI
jgi:N-acyl-L-homoserine lactone synthetase